MDLIDLNEYRDRLQFSQELECYETEVSKFHIFQALSEKQKQQLLRKHSHEGLCEWLEGIADGAWSAHRGVCEGLIRDY